MKNSEEMKNSEMKLSNVRLKENFDAINDRIIRILEMNLNDDTYQNLLGSIHHCLTTTDERKGAGDELTDREMKCSYMKKYFWQNNNKMVENLLENVQPSLEVIERLELKFDGLLEKVDEMEFSLTKSKENSRELISQTTELQKKYNEKLLEDQLLTSYQHRFLLNEKEKLILTQLNDKNEKLCEEFFRVFEKIERIRKNSKILLQCKETVAAVQIMEEISHHYELANEELYKWVQNRVTRLSQEEIIDISKDLENALEMMLNRPILFYHIIKEYGRTRGKELLNCFVKRLIDSNRQQIDSFNSSNPDHKLDIVRFTSDVFAWLHQTIATERENSLTILKSVRCRDKLLSDNELTKNLFYFNSISQHHEREEEKKEGKIEEKDYFIQLSIPSNQFVLLILDTATSYLSKVFNGKLSKLFISPIYSLPSIHYQLIQIFSFYIQTLTNHLPYHSQLMITIRDLYLFVRNIFKNTIHTEATRIMGNFSNKNIKSMVTERIIIDLQPPDEYQSFLTSFGLMIYKPTIVKYSRTLSIFNGTEDDEKNGILYDANKEIISILKNVTQTLLSAINLGATQLTRKSDINVFTLNCLIPLKYAISMYERHSSKHTQEIMDMMEARISTEIESLANEQVSQILIICQLSEIYKYVLVNRKKKGLDKQQLDEEQLDEEQSNDIPKMTYIDQLFSDEKYRKQLRITFSKIRSFFITPSNLFLPCILKLRDERIRTEILEKSLKIFENVYRLIYSYLMMTKDNDNGDDECKTINLFIEYLNENNLRILSIDEMSDWFKSK
ncbi:hypothetical protein SNEBB_008441 [Seison nebaliae]|nr:hypothetical protein SNEBB_008441 [Seison nebaliae]